MEINTFLLFKKTPNFLALESANCLLEGQLFQMNQLEFPQETLLHFTEINLEGKN